MEMNGYSGNEDVRAEARKLRVDPGLSRSQLMKMFGVGNGTLTEWLKGIDPPDWTRRPRAKDDMRELARELRGEGRTVPEIAEALEVSKSSAYLWTRDMPLDATPEEAAARRSRHSKNVAEARWKPLNEQRDRSRAVINSTGADWVGELTDRELLLVGAMAYWCEGQKAKPWEPNRCRVKFINSDPDLVLLFVRFMEVLGGDRRELRYRIHIHQSADVGAAERWWADVVGVPVERFMRATLKTHNPVTVRHNTGDDYRGCLIIDVPKSREVYWRIEGLIAGIGRADGVPMKVTRQASSAFHEGGQGR
ncbi:resolvase [Actinoplanes sp. HUAS TT8]|uniref:resolvase n=1 Tax=Actinoplanes sp. HUAS TT8 TaxID=3447453 RepID=UPI003F51D6F7